MKYRISRKAEDDLEIIWRFTRDNWSKRQADRYLNLIFDEIEFLAENPLSGHELSSVRKDYLYSKVKSHLIFYKYRKSIDIIDVIRVLHERMDLENKINE